MIAYRHETSGAAWHDFKDSPREETVIYRILKYLRDRQPQGPEGTVGGFIWDFLETELGIPHQTGSGTITHLVEMDLVYDSGFRDKTRRGKAAIEWRTRLKPEDPIPHVPARQRAARSKDSPVEFSMTGHSPILGGSTAARILACPASYHEQLKSPSSDTPSSYAEEGTMLHSMIAGMMGGTGVVEDMVNSEQAETLLKAGLLLDDLKALYGTRYSTVSIEATLPMPHIPGSFGSVDLIVKNREAVIVVDWKFGRGVLVRATYDDGNGETFNPQLMFYAIAARARFKTAFKNRKIVLAVIQPRATEPMDFVEVTNDDLDKFHEAFQHAFIEALSRNAWRERGEHCRFASCKATCPLWTGPVVDMALLDPKRAALEASLKPVEATEYGDYMSHALSMAELAETWAGEIRKQGHLYLEDGGYIPLWKLVPKRGLRKWASEDDAVADLMKIGAVQGDVFSLPELRSVAQVEKSLKAKGIALPEDLWMLSSSGSTIAPSDDPRPETTHGQVVDNARKALKAL